jgi:hypothetical protein
MLVPFLDLLGAPVCLLLTISDRHVFLDRRKYPNETIGSKLRRGYHAGIVVDRDNSSEQLLWR